MSLSRTKNIFTPASINSIAIINCDFQSIGSSGGKGSNGKPGGRGGGIFFLNVSDTLDIEGTISVNGDKYGDGDNSGGGSGGSILIRTVTFEGSGTVQVSSCRVFKRRVSFRLLFCTGRGFVTKTIVMRRGWGEGRKET